MWWLVLSALLLVAAAVLRLWAILPDGGAKRKTTKPRFSCLVVLGSGGHTAEMLYDLRSLGSSLLARLDFTFVIAATDRGSQAHADAFEREQGKSSANVVRVPRAREVGQSFVSSVPSTLNATWFTLRHVLGLLPDIVLTNGPGTCVPVVFCAYLCIFFGLRQTAVVYSESFACVDHLSLSGKILYRIADRFTVQWPQLLPLCPRALYAGRLALSKDGVRAAGLTSSDDAATAIVTVGSTKFDALIEAIDSERFLVVLEKLGVRRLKVQKGNGAYEPEALRKAGGKGSKVEVEVFDYASELAPELRKAALVVSHAGAGTILDSLMAARRMVVVPNETLMANHQIQLGLALQEHNLLFCFRPSELLDGLHRADFTTLRRFPTKSNPTFARCVLELLGVSE